MHERQHEYRDIFERRCPYYVKILLNVAGVKSSETILHKNSHLHYGSVVLTFEAFPDFCESGI